MKVDFKRWFCDQLVAIDSVRSAKVQGDHIDIQTWSGVVIYAYILDEPTKARTIKRIVQENTRIGIGTLFVVNAEIVPDDGAQVEPDEELLALHALFKDKLYTYRIEEDGTPKIGQVHFKARGDQREVWYGPDITIGHLPSFRIWVNTPQSIKGNWMIANFGTDSFWKQSDYMIGRDAFREHLQRRAVDRSRFRFWAKPGWNSAMGGESPGEGYAVPPSAPESELDRSYKQLGLPSGAPDDEVKAAFRRLAREYHPDVSDLPKEEAEIRFKMIYDAYAFIKSANGW
ncbi:MAG: DnaJ domain-containing protein [Chloroflexota bacterium]